MEETAIFRRIHVPLPVDLLRARYVTHSFVPHVHEGYAIGLIEYGAETFTYKGCVQVAPAGHMVAVNPDTMHTGNAATPDGWRYRMLYFTSDLIRASFPEDRWEGTPYFPDPVMNAPDLQQRFLHLHEVLERSDLRLEQESCFLEVIGAFFRRYGRDAPQKRNVADASPEKIRRAKEYLEGSLGENLSLEELASAVSLSPWHLHRSFLKSVGMPPHAYLLSLRVRKAKELLAKGIPIAQVAQATGFVDQSHLNRRFKRVYGVAPGAFVEAAEKGARLYKTDTGF